MKMLIVFVLGLVALPAILLLSAIEGMLPSDFLAQPSNLEILAWNESDRCLAREAVAGIGRPVEHSRQPPIGSKPYDFRQ